MTAYDVWRDRVSGGHAGSSDPDAHLAQVRSRRIADLPV